jgi:hypothetical protein
METVIVNEETLDAQFVQVSPAMARSLLGQNYKKNRPLSKANVNSFVYRMKHGQFRQGTVIELVRNGASDILIDGQHRLAAIEQSGMTQQMLILSRTTKDVDKEYALADGAGKKRTINDSLKALGITDPKVLHGVAPLRMIGERFRDGGFKTESGEKSVWQHDRFVVAEVMENWAHIIVRYWNDSEAKPRTADYRIKKAQGFMAIALLCYREQPELAREFFPKVIEGADLGHNTPAFAFRRTLDELWFSASKRRGIVKSTQILGLAASAWNKYTSGEEAKNLLRWSDPQKLNLISNYEV